ncbi:hypothetical protein AB1N83_008705, partial [Pleurotus pulmonarius]
PMSCLSRTKPTLSSTCLLVTSLSTPSLAALSFSPSLTLPVITAGTSP